MKRFLPFLFIFILAPVVSAQSDNSSACPSISVNGPMELVKPGETATYSVQIESKGLQLNPQYIWSVSAGEILKGQGTTSIDVRQPEMANLTVTVEVRGLPNGCPNTASETSIVDPAPEAIKLDEFVGPTSRIDKTRLDDVTDIMRKNPNDILWIFVGYKKAEGAETRQQRREYILQNLDLNRDEDRRIVFVDASENFEIIQFWRVPPGAEPPTCKECREIANKANMEHCPAISVAGPAGVIEPGGIATFTGTVGDGTSSNTSYSWTVSEGEIVSGQNTPSLQVRIPHSSNGGGINVTATLEIQGLLPGCSNKASEHFVEVMDPTTEFIDEYGPVSIRQEYARVREAAKKLKNDQNSILFLVKYPGKSQRAFNQRIRLLKRFASNVLHIENGRFKIAIGPNINQGKTKVFLTPAGVTNPTP